MSTPQLPTDQPASIDIRSASFWQGIISAVITILQGTGVLHDQTGQSQQQQDNSQSDVEKYS